jgi:hypothetical protein
MDKELVKTIITSSVAIFTALLPLIINYFGKKSKDTARKNLLDESQELITFINNYYESLKKFLPDAELEVYKSKLAAELLDLKTKINVVNERHANTTSGAHFTFQKIFLTFRPLTFMGWIWAIFFYVDLCILLISLLGAAVDAETGEFSGTAFYKSIFKEGGITAIVTLVGLLVLFRWLAVRNYKRHARLLPA